MTRRLLAVALAVAAAVSLSGTAHADDPQEICVGFKDNQAYCVYSEDEEGFTPKLPPIGTVRVQEILQGI